MTGMEVREPAVAGAFYPDDAQELRTIIERYLRLAGDVDVKGKVRGIVVPHAGYIYSGPIAAYGYKALSKAKFDKAIILGPSHYATFPGACESGYGLWETPLGRVRAISASGWPVSVFPQAHGPEHCLEVQLPFLQVICGDRDIEVWPLLCGQVEPAELAERIIKELDAKTVVIASSDLSHYNDYDTARKIDSIANKAVPSLDIPEFGREGDACGKTAILTLMHIAKKKKWKGVLLDYRNSGDTAGPKSSVVGYGCYAFYEER
ncbi:AmmeMemoRadiSam system protein B [Candidatus Micrarchaeota archaeon]|nr:AmmeMemoRadiSam system protein B [Candidatus Micrarchaeota archaeon]